MKTSLFPKKMGHCKTEVETECDDLQNIEMKIAQTQHFKC